MFCASRLQPILWRKKIDIVLVPAYKLCKNNLGNAQLNCGAEIIQNLNLNRSWCHISSSIFWVMFTIIYDLKSFLLKIFSYLPSIKRSWRGHIQCLKDFLFQILYVVAWYLGEIKHHFQIAQMYASIWLHLDNIPKLGAFMRFSLTIDLFCCIRGLLHNCEVTIYKENNQYLEKYLDPSLCTLDFILVWIKS